MVLSAPAAPSLFSDSTDTASLVIAIDGPAASGKGTLARRLAGYFSVFYLDTGSLYRAVGCHLLEAGKDPHNEADALTAAGAITPTQLSSNNLYQEGIGAAASIVSAMPAVREALLEYQRKVASTPPGAVLDGRDIGTVICPNAPYKFFVTANLEARAQRRYEELFEKGHNVTEDSVRENLRLRDERDQNRSVSPLKPAEDAIVIDTTGMNADEVFTKVLSYFDMTDSSLPKAGSQTT